MEGNVRRFEHVKLDQKALIDMFSPFDQPTMITSGDGAIIWVSESMSRFLDASPSELIGSNGNKLIGLDGRPICASAESASNHRVFKGIGRFQKAMGIEKHRLVFECAGAKFHVITYRSASADEAPFSLRTIHEDPTYGKLPTLIVDIRSGMIVDANAAAQRVGAFFSFDPQGISLYDILETGRAQSFTQFSSAIRGEIRQLELAVRLASGARLLCEAIAKPAEWDSSHYLQLIVINIEGREGFDKPIVSEGRLSGSDEVFHNVLIGEKGEIIHASKSFGVLLGISQATLVGRDIFEYVPERWASTQKMQFAELFKTGLRSFEMPFAVGGSIEWFEAYAAQIDKGSYLLNLSSPSTEPSLRKSGLEIALLEQLFENYPMAIMLSEKDSTIIKVNKACVDMFGYTDKEIIGRRADDLIVPEGDMEQARKISQESASGKELRFTGKRRRKDGKIIDVQFIGLPIIYKDKEVAFLAIYQDISERKSYEDELMRTLAFLKSLFEVAPDGIFYKDLEGRFQMVSKTLAARRGLAPSELVGMTYYDILPESTADRLASLDKKVLQGAENIVVEDRLPTQVGEREFEITLSPVKDPFGNIAGIIGLSHDITDRKKAERLVREVNDKLMAQFIQLEKTWLQTISVLATASEARDLYTAGHQKRVAQLAKAIGTRMGLDQDTLKGLELAGIVHDIGKIDIPIEILTKPGTLEDVELEILKTHSEISWRILKDIDFPWPLAEIAYQHHERLDGSGYPNRLEGDQILLEARILAIADIVEAMSSNRPYRPALGIEAALNEIRLKSAVSLDKDAVEACLDVFLKDGFQFREFSDY